MSVGTAPGKAILFGEHAVVYGHPAIAIPLESIQARAEVFELQGQPAGRIRLQAPDIGLSGWLHELDPDLPLARAVQRGLEALGAEHPPALEVQVSSEIPMASGLGSSAAVTVALLRALATHFGAHLSPASQSALAYDIEVLYHGTPSGVDNTVVAYERPVWYRLGEPPSFLAIGAPLLFLIGDTGQTSETAVVVAEVRLQAQRNPQLYQPLFEQIGAVAEAARRAIERGSTTSLGALMDQNHELLQQIGVSSESLDRLVEAARGAGADGAKLSGAGQGGNMLALVPQSSKEVVWSALQDVGAVRVLETRLGG